MIETILAWIGLVVVCLYLLITLGMAFLAVVVAVDDWKTHGAPPWTQWWRYSYALVMAMLTWPWVIIQGIRHDWRD